MSVKEDDFCKVSVEVGEILDWSTIDGSCCVSEKSILDEELVRVKFVKNRVGGLKIMFSKPERAESIDGSHVVVLSGENHDLVEL